MTILRILELQIELHNDDIFFINQTVFRAWNFYVLTEENMCLFYYL